MTPMGRMRGSSVARVQLSPPSSDLYKPSRRPASTILPAEPATMPRAWRPTADPARPFALRRAHVVPPSFDLKIAAGGVKGGRSPSTPASDGRIGRAGAAPRDAAAGYSVAYTIPDASGAAAIDGQPLSSSTNNVFV